MNIRERKNIIENGFQKLQQKLQNLTFRPKNQTQNPAENPIYSIRVSVTLKWMDPVMGFIRLKPVWSP